MIDTHIPAAKAAELLSLTENALAKMRHTGDSPPYVKIGRRVRYRLSDIEAWLDVRRHTST